MYATAAMAPGRGHPDRACSLGSSMPHNRAQTRAVGSRRLAAPRLAISVENERTATAESFSGRQQPMPHATQPPSELAPGGAEKNKQNHRRAYASGQDPGGDFPLEGRLRPPFLLSAAINGS
jgi:hypothetical protein